MKVNPETTMRPDRPALVNTKALLEYGDVYVKGERICSLAQYMQEAVHEMLSADPWRKAYEEHLALCNRPLLIPADLRQEYQTDFNTCDPKTSPPIFGGPKSRGGCHGFGQDSGRS